MTGLLKFALAAVVLVAVFAISVLYVEPYNAGGTSPGYRTAKIVRGSIASVVSAGGKLNAVVTVDVGTQISGMIKTISADFNSEVKAGMVIARIDPRPFLTAVNQAKAELAIAHARVSAEEASLVELDAQLEGHFARLTDADNTLRRKRSLLASNAASSATVDTATANQRQAEAQVRAAKARKAQQVARIELARAQVEQKSAAVAQRQLDLDYTFIRSPVNGVVINRNVDVGQTVASSLQAPVLFQIAQDLRRMQVRVSADEADIGRVAVGQRVAFAVDAFPGETFHGEVRQIRKASYEISNVVTYTVIVSAANQDLRLLPGMTASVAIIISEKDNALMVPDTAVRLRLPDDKSTPAANPDWVWVLGETGTAERVEVTVGISNRGNSEVLHGKLREGQEVITGIASSGEKRGRNWLQLPF